jgi:hypothetical protein
MTSQVGAARRPLIKDDSVRRVWQAMLAMAESHVRPVPRPMSAETAVEQQWRTMLADARTPQERDEINDVFGRATAA